MIQNHSSHDTARRGKVRRESRREREQKRKEKKGKEKKRKEKKRKEKKRKEKNILHAKHTRHHRRVSSTHFEWFVEQNDSWKKGRRRRKK